MADEPQDELTAEPRKYTVKRGSRSRTARRLAVATLVVGGVAAIVYPLVKQNLSAPAVETSRAGEFQETEQGASFGRVGEGQSTPDEPPIQIPKFDPGPIEDALDAQRRELEAQNQRLQSDVARLQSDLRDLASAPAEAGNGAEMATALQEMQRQNAALARQLQEEMDNRLGQAALENQRRLAEERTARETAAAMAAQKDREAAGRAQEAAAQQAQLAQLIAQVQRENQALTDQMDGGLSAALADQAAAQREADLEADRRAALEARQEEARALREAQIRSKGVIYDVGATTSSETLGAGRTVPAGSAGGGENARRADQRRLSPDEAGRQFVLEGAEPALVSTAKVIANPSSTVLQGTLIAATMETALDSSLPGQITAVVNRPVWSFDQSRILIPQGSRLFGAYDSDVSLGQARVLVGWTRLVTPEGQSVQLAAFGADGQGRSGVTGKVNSRFGQRFGSAALLSFIGAGPSVAASTIDDDLARDVGSRISDNFADTTNVVIGQYASLPPIISVQAGAAITVIVDRDLVFF